MQWLYDEVDKIWLSGEPQNGCGVYQTERSKKWYANVICKGDRREIGPFDTVEQCMDMAEREFNVMKLDKMDFMLI
jgi:hypothetical protein